MARTAIRTSPPKQSTRLKRALPAKRTPLLKRMSPATCVTATKRSLPPKKERLGYERVTELAHQCDVRDIAASVPPPVPPPPPLDPRLMARNIREVGPAAALYAAMSSFYGGKLELAVYKELVEGVLHDLGDPQDPMERMLAEQIILGHHVVGRLQARAAGQEKAENAEVYLRGATKLMSEFRKHLELFSRLRTQSSADPHASSKAEANAEPPKKRDTELASKGRKRVAHAA